jgi:hypothetical protein
MAGDAAEPAPPEVDQHAADDERTAAAADRPPRPHEWPAPYSWWCWSA